MRKLLILIALLLAACTPSEDDVQRRVNNLLDVNAQLEAKNRDLRSEYMRLQKEVADLRGDDTVMLAMKNGKKIHYIVKVSIRQVSYSLSVSKQLRDLVNEDEFEMPVDLDTYQRVKIGDNLFDSWRAGSIIFHGSLSSWRLKVADKRMVTE